MCGHSKVKKGNCQLSTEETVIRHQTIMETVFLYLYPPILDQRRMLRKKLRSEITEIGQRLYLKGFCPSRTNS